MLVQKKKKKKKVLYRLPGTYYIEGTYNRFIAINYNNDVRDVKCKCTHANKKKQIYKIRMRLRWVICYFQSCKRPEELEVSTDY